VLIAYGQLPMDLELSHDILCISRSNDNRRVAGAVDFSAFKFILFKQILQQIVGPAARHFGVFCVFCG
jgi:hypothetical protein